MMAHAERPIDVTAKRSQTDNRITLHLNDDVTIDLATANGAWEWGTMQLSRHRRSIVGGVIPTTLCRARSGRRRRNCTGDVRMVQYPGVWWNRSVVGGLLQWLYRGPDPLTAPRMFVN